MLDKDDEVVIRESKNAGATLVTNDRILREAAGGATPQQAIEAARVSPGVSPAEKAKLDQILIQMTPGDLTVLAEAGNATVELFQKCISVNPKEAKLVRKLRVDEGLSWRAIARFFSKLWAAPWGGNQIAGMVICEKAARALNEDFLKTPWN